MKISNTLVNYSIFVVGTGATGSQLLPFLAQLLNNFTKDYHHRLILIDGDKFEEKNLKNQKCTIYDITRNKAEVLSERYQLVYKDLDVSYVDEYLTDPNKLLNLIKECSFTFPIIVGCVDNNASRRVLNEVFNQLNECIYIDSGNGTKDRNGQIVVGYKSKGKVKLTPVCKVFKDILTSKDSLKQLTSCGQVVDEYPQNIATNVMAASTIFSIINEIITEKRINVHVANFDAERTLICSHGNVED